MFPIVEGVEFCIEIRCAGTGGFDGATERMRASVTLPGALSSGNVTYRAKYYGATANSYSIQQLNPGNGINFTTTTVEQNGTNIYVKLRRDASTGILATAEEVADAVNKVTAYGFPIVAEAPTSSTVVQASALTALSGGVDFDSIDPTRRTFVKTFTNQNVGVFHFGNFREGLQIRKIQTNFTLSSPSKLKIQSVRFTPGLAMIADSKGPVFDYALSSALPDYGISDIKDPLLPYEGLVISCKDSSNNPQPGFIRLYAKRAANFPY